MEEYQSTPPIQQQAQKRTKVMPLLWVLVALIFTAATSFGVYAWQQKEVQELEKKVQELKATAQPLETDNKAKDEPQLSEDDKVTAAFNRHCDAIIVPDGFERNTVIGTMTADQKKFVYSADKQFVALNGKCDFNKIGAADEGGGSAAYIFKKVSGEWIRIVATQQQVDATTVKSYGIPAEFLVTIGLN